MGEAPEHKEEKPPREDSVKPYMKYSGMAFQMIGTLLVAAFAGIKLDEYFATENPWFTIGFLLAGVIGSMVLTIISISKK
ncbi:AtpZ/AtpI family protein [Pontibacter beigongshangensis]|uniref:AtpZ/AtpI family protein n=1 Tax=Pontibacter beigongshangensis TaxID=2574733 RepID=UPI001F513290|nr:AtpZ/AtpI family protein [Pontibacter beigongshangensis]